MVIIKCSRTFRCSRKPGKTIQMWLFQINNAEQDTAGPERQCSGYRLFTTLLQLRGRSKRWLRLYSDMGGWVHVALRLFRLS